MMVPSVDTGGGGLSFSAPASSATGAQQAENAFRGGDIAAPSRGNNLLLIVIVVAVAYVAAKAV